MKILNVQGNPDLATVYVASFGEDRLVEFVEAREPGVSKDDKWVMIVSTQLGCPVACPMCDAGGDFKGNLSKDEMLAQIDYLMGLHSKKRMLGAKKLKIQFARMGEPSLNDAVLDVLEELPKRYDAPGLIPCIATVAPTTSKGWFERLIKIRREVYGGREFQLQLSINSTCEIARDKLMPVPKLSFEEMNVIATLFCEGGPRKVTLNFAYTENNPIDPVVIADNFDASKCLVKITPLNPTERSAETGLSTALPPKAPEKCEELCKTLQKNGFDVIISIGDERENEIGSNCGMAIKKLKGEIS